MTMQKRTLRKAMNRMPRPRQKVIRKKRRLKRTPLALHQVVQVAMTNRVMMRVRITTTTRAVLPLRGRMMTRKRRQKTKRKNLARPTSLQMHPP